LIALEPFFRTYISVPTLRDREIARWRDYLDPVAVLDVLDWPTH